MFRKGIYEKQKLDVDWGVFHKDGERCLLLSMDPCHDCNLVKFDFLVLKSLKLINMCCQLAGIKYPRMHEMNFDDKDVWEDMAKNPDGLFQFESEFAAEYGITTIILSATPSAIRLSNMLFTRPTLNQLSYVSPVPWNR